MLTALASFAVRHRVAVILFVLLILSASPWALAGLRFELLPQVAPHEITVRTEAPGLSPRQVEERVTTIVEQALLGAPGAAMARSISTQGLSTISINLREGVEAQAERQAVLERLQGLQARLPPGVAPPQMTPLVAPDGPLLIEALVAQRSDPMRAREIAEFTIRPHLLAVPGVADVAVYGGASRRIEVRGRPGDLADSDLSLLDLVRAAETVTSVGGAGFVDTPAQRVLVDARGQAATTEQIAAGQIQTPTAAPVRIGDVADVVVGATPPLGDALVDGAPAVLLEVRAAPGADTLRVARSVEAALAAADQALAPQGLRLRPISTPLEDRLRAAAGRDLLAALLAGAAIALVLWIVLRDLRSIAVSFASLLVSGIVTLDVLSLAGVTVNAVTFAGLAVVAGLVIDDAVLDIEFILARLRRPSRDAATHEDAIQRAAAEIRAPVFAGAALAVIAVTPLLLISGAAGAALRPLVVAIVVGTGASLVVTAVFTPALASLVVRHAPAPHESRVLDRLRAGALSGASALRGASTIIVVAALALVVALGIALPLEPLPNFKTAELRLDLQAAPSLSHAAAKDLFARLSRDIGALPDVARTAAEIGRDPTDVRAAGLGAARMIVVPRPGASDRSLERAVRRALANFPGLQAALQSRVTTVAARAAAAPSYSVEVSGPDYGQISAYAGQVRDVLAATPGARGVRSDVESSTPALRADVEFPKLALYGLSAADVVEMMQTAFAGRPVATLYEGPVPIPVTVTAGFETSADPESVGDLLLRSTAGVATPLARVARIWLDDAPTELVHVGGRRSVAVYADPEPRALGRFASEVGKAIRARAPAPAGVSLAFPDAGRGVARPRLRLAAAGAVALLAMLSVLTFGFRNPRTALVAFAGAGLALAGAMAAAALVIRVIDLGVLVGLAAVFGLAARTTILLIANLERRLAPEGAVLSFETVLAAVRERFAAALLSSTLLILAVAPLALAGGPAAELLTSMVVVLVGGLLVGGVLLVLVLPGFVARLWRPHARQLRPLHPPA